MKAKSALAVLFAALAVLCLWKVLSPPEVRSEVAFSREEIETILDACDRYIQTADFSAAMKREYDRKHCEISLLGEAARGAVIPAQGAQVSADDLLVVFPNEGKRDLAQLSLVVSAGNYQVLGYIPGV